MIDRAIQFAAAAHAGQRRRYTNEPYICHPIRVLSILMLASGVTPEMMAAAVLHDTIEDAGVGSGSLRTAFGHDVTQLVIDVTTPKAVADIAARDARSRVEAKRLATIRPQAQTIKYADIIDNTATIRALDPGFADVYLREKANALAVMKQGDYGLWKQAYDIVSAPS